MILHDPITTEKFAAMADYVIIDMEPIDPDRINESEIVFCNTKRTRELYKILKTLDHRITLITSQLHGTPCSDYNVHESYVHILPWAHARPWFVKNKNNYGPGIAIPIGVLPDKVDEMNRAYSEGPQDRYFLYANGTINTNMGEREPAFVCAKRVNGAYVYSGEHVPYAQYIRDIRDSKYVLCPPGYGIDTWRLWETLYMGSIPVVRRSPMTEEFAKKFPIIMLDFWEELEELEDIAADQIDPFMSYDQYLSFGYWENLIRGGK
jgi:hypothetical protein